MQPLLNLINNYDANTDYTVEYTYLGASRITTNELSIREAKVEAKPVYTRQSTKFDKNHTIPKGSLENGKTYWASIRVQTESGWTEWSPEVTFMCLTTPKLVFDSLDSENYIYNDDIMMRVIYRQQQGEKVKTYRFTLLDQNKQPIERYPVRTPDESSPNILQERMRNLIKGKLYYVGIRIETRNGLVHYADHEFIPHFITPTLNGVIKTELQEATGQVLVQSFLKQMLGTQTKPFIEGMDIANDEAYTYYKDDWIIIPHQKPLMYKRLGMSKASDWIAKIWCKNVPNGVMLDFSKEDGGLPKLTFIKHDDYITCEKTQGGIKSRTKSNVVKGLKLKEFYLYIKVVEYRIEMKIVPK